MKRVYIALFEGKKEPVFGGLGLPAQAARSELPLADELKAWRKRNQVTQKQLAEKRTQSAPQAHPPQNKSGQVM